MRIRDGLTIHCSPNNNFFLPEMTFSPTKEVRKLGHFPRDHPPPSLFGQCPNFSRFFSSSDSAPYFYLKNRFHKKKHRTLYLVNQLIFANLRRGLLPKKNIIYVYGM